MIDVILNNPHYFMFGMIVLFVIAVAVMAIMAFSTPQRSRDDTPSPTEKITRKNATGGA